MKFKLNFNNKEVLKMIMNKSKIIHKDYQKIKENKELKNIKFILNDSRISEDNRKVLEDYHNYTLSNGRIKKLSTVRSKLNKLRMFCRPRV